MFLPHYLLSPVYQALCLFSSSSVPLWLNLPAFSLQSLRLCGSIFLRILSSSSVSLWLNLPAFVFTPL